MKRTDEYFQMDLFDMNQDIPNRFFSLPESGRLLMYVGKVRECVKSMGDGIINYEYSTYLSMLQENCSYLNSMILVVNEALDYGILDIQWPNATLTETIERGLKLEIIFSGDRDTYLALKNL